jgi:hypothetical protein
MAIGHRLIDEGAFERAPTRISIAPAAGGLWTTAADLVRFELPGGEAAFRLELQVPETRPVGERTRLIGQCSPSLIARGSATSGGKDMPSTCLMNR